MARDLVLSDVVKRSGGAAGKKKVPDSWFKLACAHLGLPADTVTLGQLADLQEDDLTAAFMHAQERLKAKSIRTDIGRMETFLFSRREKPRHENGARFGEVFTVPRIFFIKSRTVLMSGFFSAREQERFHPAGIGADGLCLQPLLGVHERRRQVVLLQVGKLPESHSIRG